MWWLLALFVGCGPSEPDPLPPRVTPEAFTTARAWVRTVVADGPDVYWANYDVSSGRSARAVIDRVDVRSGERVEGPSEPHPPLFLHVYDGFLYWSYDNGPLRRQRVDGGEPERVLDHVRRACVEVDDSGLYYIKGADVLHVDPASGAQRVVSKRVLGDCVVAIGDHVYWTERKGIYTAPKAGGDPRQLVALGTPKQLVEHEGALYACVDDVLTRIDPSSGESKPIRGFCQGDGLVVGENAHWVRTPYFEGWPPEERVRIVEVTSAGLSYLFDGRGASPPVIADGQLVWFGRGDEGGVDWQGFRAPLP